jgi:UDP-2-acetamido-3-amino-2,3-dideoxy-glucuronate N-acetyltransferase
MNFSVHPTAIVDEGAQIGAGAVVHKDVKPYALMVGVPARQIGWMSEHGEQMPLSLEGEGSYTCPQTGVRYRLENGQLNPGRRRLGCLG